MRTVSRGAEGARPARARLVAELSRLIETHRHRDDLGLPGLRLFSTDVIGEPTSTVAEAAIAFVAQGAKRIAVGDHVLDYGPGDYLVVSVDLPVTGRFTAASRTEPFLGIGLTLDHAAIAALLLEAPPDWADGAAPRPAPRRPAIGTSSASPDLLDALARLLRLIEEPQADKEVLGPMVLREILWRLLRGEQGELVRQIGTHDSSLAQIGQAVRWIRLHYADPFRVEDLAERVAMSASSFHRHFRAATTMGPVQFQKKIRLQQARLLLIGSGMNITRVALAVGYESPSQFSREYRREYGASPRQDMTHRQTG